MTYNVFGGTLNLAQCQCHPKDAHTSGNVAHAVQCNKTQCVMSLLYTFSSHL